LRDRHRQHGEAAIARALQGNWRAEHLVALQQAVELYEVYHQHITACDRQVKRTCRPLWTRGKGKCCLTARATASGERPNHALKRGNLLPYDGRRLDRH
jgi:hypothetical protein